VPEGAYEINDLSEYIKFRLANEKIAFFLRGNKNIIRAEIKCSEKFDFENQDAIDALLGFPSRVRSADKLHNSDKVVYTFKTNVIQIDCNIVSGTNKNGRQGYTLHEFFPRVSSGYKIVEVPREVIYLPVNTRTVDNLNVRVTDQNGDLINFNREELIDRLHLKRINNGARN
jgi:hypothetical protein